MRYINLHTYLILKWCTKFCWFLWLLIRSIFFLFPDCLSDAFTESLSSKYTPMHCRLPDNHVPTPTCPTHSVTPFFIYLLTCFLAQSFTHSLPSHSLLTQSLCTYCLCCTYLPRPIPSPPSNLSSQAISRSTLPTRYQLVYYSAPA